jgi:formyltetrahydrofolate-dependent phosphoribosylglycinamide formyltransferase
MKVGVFASGSGTDLQALLDVCCGDAAADIVLVVSNRSDAPALDRARNANVATAVLDDPQDGAHINSLLEQHDIDLVVCAGYLKLIPAETVQAYTGRIINIHPALLPSFGGPGMYGMRVHEAVLASGATVSGATVHLVTEQFDRGTIVAQWPVPVRADDSPASLADRVLAVEHQLLPAVVLAAGREGGVKRLSPHGSHYQLADDADVQLQSA